MRSHHLNTHLVFRLPHSLGYKEQPEDGLKWVETCSCEIYCTYCAFVFWLIIISIYLFVYYFNIRRIRVKKEEGDNAKATEEGRKWDETWIYKIDEFPLWFNGPFPLCILILQEEKCVHISFLSAWALSRNMPAPCFWQAEFRDDKSFMTMYI